MRVLMLHNRYRFEGGEERAVADIIGLLGAHGHTVHSIVRSSAQLTGLQAARGLVRGGTDPEEVAEAVRRLRPDVVHAHNIHPSFGWRALAAAREAGARTVLHVHNFRLFCAIGVAYRDGAPCFRCRGRETRPGIRFRCRGSIHEALAYAVGLHMQQPRIFEHVDRFVTVSDASAGRLFELGLPAERTHTVRNFLPAESFAPASNAGRGEYALAGGRLVEEKGFDIAIAAARAARVPLLIAGDGPDLQRLKQLGHGADVGFTGRLDPGAMAEVRRRAGVVLVPSRSEEACPYAALEALADGVPVLASHYGGLPEVVGSEAVVAGHDPRAWADALQQLWRDPEQRQSRGSEALERARALFSQERYFNDLMSVYQS